MLTSWPSLFSGLFLSAADFHFSIPRTALMMGEEFLTCNALWHICRIMLGNSKANKSFSGRGRGGLFYVGPLSVLH